MNDDLQHTPRHLNEWGDTAQRSVTVTYGLDGSDEIATKVGIGDSYQDALADADAQLRIPGVWLRLCVSQPSSIPQDVRNNGRHRYFRGNRHGEREAFEVPFFAGEPPAGFLA